MSDNSNLGNVIGGHKAALNNPNVSEEAKERSREVIDSLEGERQDTGETDPTAGKNEGNFLGGHKAAVKNPNVSKEAKEHSQQVLEEFDTN